MNAASAAIVSANANRMCSGAYTSSIRFAPAEYVLRLVHFGVELAIAAAEAPSWIVILINN